MYFILPVVNSHHLFANFSDNGRFWRAFCGRFKGGRTPAPLHLKSATGMGLPDGQSSFKICLTVYRHNAGVWQTDRQTDRHCTTARYYHHHYQPTLWLLTDSTHRPQHLCNICTLFVSFAVFISTAYHLLSGFRAARLLLNWTETELKKTALCKASRG